MKLQNIFKDVEMQYQSLETHPVFSALNNIQDLQTFMSWHVFAVWDFMSLAKFLQRELTCIDLPWTPPKHPQAARLINEIILGEECDELPDQGYLSHYELYLLSMEEVGADTTQVRQFVRLVGHGVNVAEALIKVDAHPRIQEFVNHTMSVVNRGDLREVLGNFFFGRENVIPMMFDALLNKWHINESRAPMFVYYLKRHIELDSDSHGPAVWKIINELMQDDPSNVYQLKSTALEAIAARIRLWDGLLENMGSDHASTQYVAA